jgi:predicted AAA+ superfamily ATPase
MNDAELARQLTAGNAWWRTPTGWELDDPDLQALAGSPLDYQPEPLVDIAPDGLYMLRGPRRVGKSVELKRMIALLIARGVNPRRVIHFACDGLSPGDLRRLVRVARDQITRPVAEPRYWFLDEITAVTGWPSTVKWLRDNTGMGEDCVVLTGSSARDLEEARKELAGRRGRATDSDRLLMPMRFESFCSAMGVRLGDLPTIRPRDFLSGEAEDATAALLPWLDELVSLWEVYCRVGGFPAAVADYLRAGDVDPRFVDALWDVIHGDALQRGRFSAVQSLQLLRRLARNLASPVNMTGVAEDIGVASHSTARERVKDLIDSYVAWPCYQRGDHQLPNLRAQEKIYFADPLIARIPHLRSEQAQPDTSQISEQQIGLALNLHLASGDPGRYADFTSVMYARSATKREVDFCGKPLGKAAFEGKYTDTKLARETQTMRAMFGGGVLATRAAIDQIDDVRCIPAAFIALLLG